MADHSGYNQQFTDKPEMWDVDGYAVCTDANGTLVVSINQLSTQGALVMTQQLAPSSIISAITQTGNGTGIYDVFLAQAWNQCTHADFTTVIPATLSPAILICQNQSDTVGQSGFGPGSAALQSIRFATKVPSTLAAGSLPQGSGLRFRIRLKNSSA